MTPIFLFTYCHIQIQLYSSSISFLDKALLKFDFRKIYSIMNINSKLFHKHNRAKKGRGTMKEYNIIKKCVNICLFSIFLLTGAVGCVPSNPMNGQAEWKPVVLDDEMLKYYVEYNEFGKFDQKAAIYSLYSFTTDKVWEYAEEQDGHIIIENIDENNAIAKVYYRDDSIDEVKIAKDMDKGGVWIPLEYREIQPAQLEEKFVILSYHDGNYYYDAAEWVNDFDEERIKELKALGVNDMSFENGYYVYNEKEEQIPLTIDKEAKLYILDSSLDSSLEFMEKVKESEFRKCVEENMFYGYHTIYVKDGKAFKIFQVYVP